MRRRVDWSKWGLGAYFVVFLIFLYLPMILMAILSFQGEFGQLTWPFQGPLSLHWWKSLFDQSVDPLSHANDIRTAGKNSLYLSLAAGLLHGGAKHAPRHGLDGGELGRHIEVIGEGQ